MKLLIITPRFPYPLEKGDKLRIFHQIKFLSKLHQLILISLSDQPISEEDKKELYKYCDTIHLINLSKLKIATQILKGFINGLPLQVSYFYNERIKHQIHELILSENPDHIYCQLIRVADYVRNLPYPKSIDFMDCFSLSTQRRALKSPWYSSWFFYWEAKKVAQYEKSVFFDFDHHFVISNHDKQAFNFHSKSLIKVISNGINLEKFIPLKGVEKKYDLVFVGNMGYYPNIEAAVFMVEEILPLLPEKTTILIAGARPDKRILELANSQVTISGWMDDIRKAYQAGRIFVAPIFEGAGLQNKVLEAMALRLPCVISPVVNNGLNCIEEKHILLGHDAKSFAAQILRLIADSGLAKKMIHESISFIENQYKWDLFNAKLNEVIISEYDAFNRKRTEDYA